MVPMPNRRSSSHPPTAPAFPTAMFDATGHFDTQTCNVSVPQDATHPRTFVVIIFIPHVMITGNGDMLRQQRFRPCGEDGISDT